VKITSWKGTHYKVQPCGGGLESKRTAVSGKREETAFEGGGEKWSKELERLKVGPREGQTFTG